MAVGSIKCETENIFNSWFNKGSKINNNNSYVSACRTGNLVVLSIDIIPSSTISANENIVTFKNVKPMNFARGWVLIANTTHTTWQSSVLLVNGNSTGVMCDMSINAEYHAWGQIIIALA